MSRVFPVRVTRLRSAGPEEDVYYFRAQDRKQAEDWLRDALGAALVAIHPPRTLKKEPPK